MTRERERRREPLGWHEKGTLQPPSLSLLVCTSGNPYDQVNANVPQIGNCFDVIIPVHGFLNLQDLEIESLNFFDLGC